MKAGRLRHAISILRSDTAISEAGTPVTTWGHHAQLRAERVEQSTTEFIRNFGAADETVAVFRTHYFDDITTADQVDFGGALFNIKEIVTIGWNRGLEIRCTRIS